MKALPELLPIIQSHLLDLLSLGLTGKPYREKLSTAASHSLNQAIQLGACAVTPIDDLEHSRSFVISLMLAYGLSLLDVIAQSSPHACDAVHGNAAGELHRPAGIKREKRKVFGK